ncbi:hypothetical protein HMPREF0742_01240 [Rothia aeria F0184]|uniref:Uncharacterized protein n=1 Tax=Rothia aeria F0184 TaxID=888019 RepID=U7V630_9MICC|nr:hypothetical protein HMPREF0742_01240 [Rothia aeria F0184]
MCEIRYFYSYFINYCKCKFLIFLRFLADLKLYSENIKICFIL